MNNILKTAIFSIVVILVFTRSSCDAFQSFLFNLPISFEVEATGSVDPSGSETFCLDENETYQDFRDKINSVTLTEIYAVTDSVSPASLQGNIIVELYEGLSSSGTLLFSKTLTGVRPIDYDKDNPYKLPLTNAEIQNVNNSLAEGNRCFYGRYMVIGVSSAQDNYVKAKIDILFQVDADL
jgi:hypothetical protein